MRNKAISILLLASLTSCSFNKALFKPTKIPSTAKGYSTVFASDTVKAKFSGDNHQPVFMKNGKEVTDLEYTIESITFKSTNGNSLNGWFMKPKNGTPTITLLQLHGMVIYGQSMGGHLSAVMAAQRQKAIDGLVIEGAFSSYKDIIAHRLPVLGRILTKQGYSATESIKDFHKPVLVIHSTEDKEVPFSMGKKIMAHANSPKEFFEVKQCHICATGFYADEISTKIRKMVETK